MGLIKAALGAAGGVLADQWKEYFYCESISEGVLVTKGSKRISSKRSSNTKAEDNIISNGAVIAVNDGQCMMIVEQGKVVELCAEAGEFVWNNSTEPSIFAGKLGTSILDSFKTLGKRFTFGGDTAKDQRVYYVNTKEIIGNKYGTATPIPFRFIDRNLGLDIDISLRCNGEFSYKITDPVLFYTNVCGNVAEEYERNRIDSMLKSELLSALQPAFGKFADTGLRYSALPAHTLEISDELNRLLSDKWGKLRGLQVVSFNINSVSISPDDEDMIQDLQKKAVLRDPGMAAATLAGAQAEAMQAAAKNEAGAMTGFMGFGMAQNAGGVKAEDLYRMAQTAPKAAEAPAANGWKCACGESSNQGKFCTACGAKKPENNDGWVCPVCGKTCKGKFCADCGAKKPASEPLYRCDKCGWEPADPKNPPKFCPECGDRFDANDVK
ncbi:MAG: SPFH domain-containing protein [Clostridia bacterium]|nr:SPFH domain-containing protein [Clostridia bacterium]